MEILTGVIRKSRAPRATVPYFWDSMGHSRDLGVIRCNIHKLRLTRMLFNLFCTWQCPTLSISRCWYVLITSLMTIPFGHLSLFRIRDYQHLLQEEKYLCDTFYYHLGLGLSSQIFHSHLISTQHLSRDLPHALVHTHLQPSETSYFKNMF